MRFQLVVGAPLSLSVIFDLPPDSIWGNPSVSSGQGASVRAGPASGISAVGGGPCEIR